MRPKAIVTIGMFDGVHLGHRYVLRHLSDEARRLNLLPVAVTFSRHPLAVICPEHAPKLLGNVDNRVEMMRADGIDNTVVLDFDDDLRSLTARRFIEERLMPLYDVKHVLLGYDNGFGSDRLPDVAAYRNALSDLGIEVSKCDPFPDARVSSSMIRKSLETGDVRTAARLLGRPYTVEGKVIDGKHLGRTIGFPTANLSVDSSVALPKNGVYAARWEGHPVMLNIGTAPTVNVGTKNPIIVEAHVIGVPSDINLYGRTMRLELVDRIRDERRFPSLDDLRVALSNDREAALTLLESE